MICQASRRTNSVIACYARDVSVDVWLVSTTCVSLTKKLFRDIVRHLRYPNCQKIPISKSVQKISPNHSSPSPITQPHLLGSKKINNWSRHKQYILNHDASPTRSPRHHQRRGLHCAHNIHSHFSKY